MTTNSTAGARLDTAAPLLSIVTPTYRRPQMLREALASVVAQTVTDLEVLVCDNADDPETRAVVESFDDERLVYIGRPTNLGMIANALDGFRRARGEFVVKLDDDDVLEPDALELLLRPFEGHPEMTASWGDMTLVDVDGHPMVEASDELRAQTRREGLREGYHAPFTAHAVSGAVCLAATVLRRSAIDWDTVPEWAGTSYDLYLTLQAAEDGATGHHLARSVVRYRIHAANDSVKNVVPNLEAAGLVLRAARDGGHHDPDAGFSPRLAADHSRLAREHLIEGRTTAARRHALDALRHHPCPAAARALALASLPGSLGQRVSTRRRDAFLNAQPTRTPGHRS